MKILHRASTNIGGGTGSIPRLDRLIISLKFFQKIPQNSYTYYIAAYQLKTPYGPYLVLLDQAILSWTFWCNITQLDLALLSIQHIYHSSVRLKNHPIQLIFLHFSEIMPTYNFTAFSEKLYYLSRLSSTFSSLITPLHSKLRGIQINAAQIHQESPILEI